MTGQNQLKIALIDGYLDEPSCLGVPPYVSPHIRYLYGALLDAGLPGQNITYFTADRLREECRFREAENHRSTRLEKYDLILVLAGTTVPGNYLSGQPLSLAELRDLSSNVFYPTLVLCGPITMVLGQLPGGKKLRENFDIVSGELSAADIYLRLCRREGKSGSIEADLLARDLKKGGGSVLTDALAIWAEKGTELLERHPRYPRLVIELETFRGCPRRRGCSFCSEPLKKISYQRQPDQIAAEVEAAAVRGVHNFRLGCQTDLLSYHGGRLPPEKASNRPYHSRPDGPESRSSAYLTALRELYRGIRRADPDLNVLHLDNINPGPLARHPRLGKEAVRIISRHNTAGDVAAFGLESADPAVLAANNIDTDVELTFKAIKILNQIGGRRQSGIPKILPGLNFLFGLEGESEETYRLNYRFLERIKSNDLLLRRINIRQVNALGQYQAQEVDRGRFEEFKKKVNRQINRPMLEGVFPRGTVLEGLWPEKKKGKLTYARQPGSYPILVGIPGDHSQRDRLSAQIIDWGYRSITALAHPFHVDKASRAELEAVPGIGQKRAGKIVAEKPRSSKELRELLGPSFPWAEWKDIFKFSSEDTASETQN
ncbi:radical SAM protein [Halarsenatibacter silvermanii]|uniref:Radical SAM superfamily enzyme with C-terminal helix-hairpin-helix motif n=1 Tax=Halarsenatibacter silvermanii TaxID=321763 RepID=A0A1G9LXV6_9FIRM|nr:radical SAM protein [Halarsenatibacter silvermanii]SDL66872.1 Radical SAM superfamily enzyme with C-terminal helix-hairpin-helix motif [Halarsenatibacter silvermanii]